MSQPTDLDNGAGGDMSVPSVTYDERGMHVDLGARGSVHLGAASDDVATLAALSQVAPEGEPRIEHQTDEASRPEDSRRFAPGGLVEPPETAGMVDGHVDSLLCPCGPVLQAGVGLMHTLEVAGTDLRPFIEALERQLAALAAVAGLPGYPWRTDEQRAIAADVRVETPPVNGMSLIMAERERQVMHEGYTEDHDRQQGAARLFGAGMCYLSGGRAWWPAGWGEPKPKTRLRDLIRAGALFQAAAQASTAESSRPGFDQAIGRRDECARLLDELLDEARHLLAGGA